MAERRGLVLAGIVVISWITFISCAVLAKDTAIEVGIPRKEIRSKVTMDYDTFLDYFSKKTNIPVSRLNIPPIKDYFAKKINKQVSIKPDPDTAQTVSGDLGSILCAYCQDTNDTECIKRYCFNQG